jgi:hypothetical protein
MLAATSGGDRTVQRNVHERSDDERSITHAFIRCQASAYCYSPVLPEYCRQPAVRTTAV